MAQENKTLLSKADKSAGFPRDQGVARNDMQQRHCVPMAGGQEGKMSRALRAIQIGSNVYSKSMSLRGVENPVAI